MALMKSSFHGHWNIYSFLDANCCSKCVNEMSSRNCHMRQHAVHKTKFSLWISYQWKCINLAKHTLRSSYCSVVVLTKQFGATIGRIDRVTYSLCWTIGPDCYEIRLSRTC
ncbi:hypothetical protein M758_11G034600 [Ceratodon purpureus]|nr:hypothetical protein M758_11G034600 [Ceratodon purpureus]